MINRAILVGNIGKDVQFEDRGDYKQATTTLATSYKKTGAAGKEDVTTWHNLYFYNKLAEVANLYLKKGSKVYIEGRIENKSWQDESGQWKNMSKIIVRDIQMLDKKEDSSGGYQQVSNGYQQASSGYERVKSGEIAHNYTQQAPDYDSDIPF